MKKILAGSLCFILLISSILSSATFIEKNKDFEEINEQTGFQAINIDETTIIINVNPGEFIFNSINIKEGIFATIDLPGYVYSLVKGEAKLPIIRKMIEIPQEANPELIVKSISWEFTSLEELELPERIIPAQQSIEKIPEPSKIFVIDEEYYNTEIFMPKEDKEKDIELRLHESLLPVKDEKDKKLVKEYFSKIFTLLSKDLRNQIKDLKIPDKEKKELLNELAFLTKEEQVKYIEAIINLYQEKLPLKLIERIRSLPNIKPEHLFKIAEQLKFMDYDEQEKFVQFLENNA